MTPAQMYDRGRGAVAARLGALRMRGAVPALARVWPPREHYALPIHLSHVYVRFLYESLWFGM